ncbi:PcfJ domain-containing protein [Atlantibacter hermannii]|uniref:PcfJ domain-containing protein n=1 Tax=Atlantibacter hermannii TaxID=565 RepID=UPI002FDCCF7A
MMKVYLLKNKLIISFSPYLNVAITVYVKDGQLLSDIYHENNIQKCEIDCGIPLFNKDVMGSDAVEHIFKLLKLNCNVSLDALANYNDAQVEVFNSLQSSRSLQELFIDCPNLTWAIVLNNYYGDNSHTIEYLSRVKRRHLLSILANTSPQERIVNILKKTSMLHGRKYEFLWLSRCLQDENIIETYKHKEIITIQELYLAYRYRTLSGSALLSSICNERREFLREYKVGMCSLERLVKDSIRIGENLGIKKSKDIIMACTSKNSVKLMHDKWSQKLRETTKFLVNDILLEEPSIRVIPGIEFISSINSLIQEGKDMEHCLASYKDKVINCESYIYKITAPKNERVTVELGLSNGIYILKQAKGFRNAEPSNLAINFIHTWLDNENLYLKELLDMYKQYTQALSA